MDTLNVCVCVVYRKLVFLWIDWAIILYTNLCIIFTVELWWKSTCCIYFCPCLWKKQLECLQGTPEWLKERNQERRRHEKASNGSKDEIILGMVMKISVFFSSLVSTINFFSPFLDFLRFFRVELCNKMKKSRKIFTIW